MQIADILAYSDNCNRLLQKFLTEHPEAFDQPFETLSNFKSIRELMAHSIGTERRWTARLQGNPVTRYEDNAPTDMEQIFADFWTTRANTRDLLVKLGDQGMNEPISYELPNWNHAGVLTAEEILFHILNHENYHRGQINMALQRSNIDALNFDYPFLNAHA